MPHGSLPSWNQAQHGIQRYFRRMAKRTAAVRTVARRARDRGKAVYRSRLPVAELWKRDLPNEVEFWRRWLLTGGLEWPEDYARRFDPHEPLGESLIDDRIKELRSAVVSIVDVGAGPATVLGKVHALKHLEITPIDPLGEEYRRILDEAGIAAPVETIPCAGDELVQMFGPARFHVAYARNSLDHSIDPLAIMSNMVQVVRPDGFVALRHSRNEGERTRYLDLHHWNFDIADGDLVVWGRQGRRNVTHELSGAVSVECWYEDDAPAPWVAAVLEPRGSMSGSDG